MKRLKASTQTSILFSALVLAGLVACSSNDDDGQDDDEACGGHGELHGDHCDCDDGYESDHDDELLCVKKHDDEECGGHGHLHDDHCDCDDGFVVDEDDDELCVEDHDDSDGMGGMGNVVLDPSPEGRLLVSDGEEGRVVVVDLEMGKAVATLAVDGPARVYTTVGGGHGIAVQSSDAVAQGIVPGLYYEDHGDHFDAKTEGPEVFKNDLVSCPTPIHYVGHDAQNAVFCDGDGMLSVFDDDWASGDVDVSIFDSGRPHHGVGLAAFGHVLLSVPNPDDEDDALPIGIKAYTFDGEKKASFETCAGLHGEASTSERACFGCATGVMCITEDGTELKSFNVDAPEDAPDGVRVGSLSASREADVIVGNWGEDLVLVGNSEGELLSIEVGKTLLQFQLVPGGDAALVLATDGSITKIEIPSGDVVAVASVLDEFELEAGHGQLRPTFAMAPHYLYVVDPRDNAVVELSLDHLNKTKRDIALPSGHYHSAAVVALPPSSGDH